MSRDIISRGVLSGATRRDALTSDGVSVISAEYASPEGKTAFQAGLIESFGMDRDKAAALEAAAIARTALAITYDHGAFNDLDVRAAEFGMTGFNHPDEVLGLLDNDTERDNLEVAGSIVAGMLRYIDQQEVSTNG